LFGFRVRNYEIAKPFTPLQNTITNKERITLSRNWTLVDSIKLREYLPASYPNGVYFDVYFDRNNETLNTFTTDYSTLTEIALQAILKAPRWLRPPLQLRLKSIPEDKQDLWGNLILNTNDPYVDEIAFSIATLSPAYLMSNLANPEVLLTNAVNIYLNDMFLDYAEVVDYGTSDTDEDYYTTVRYWKMNENGEFEQVEIPKEIYYWYIAHPKITDEIPAFIDPDILEYDHTANIVDASEGYFWRDYIFNHTFNDTLNLRDMMAGCQYVWDGIGCHYPGGDWFAQPISPYGDSLDYAIHRMTKWINGDMEFTSPGDRPHQPVRIAKKGMGRCGEYADLNAAVARTLLIPITSISNWFNIWDHTFSELWLEDWEHYESYHWEWGTTFYDTYDFYAISPYEIRSDGFLTTVTDHYVDFSTLNISVLDENDRPIDGGKVNLYVQRPDEGIRQTMVGYTDNNGLVTFKVSDSFDYYARAETWIGNAPFTGTALLVTSAVAGETYDLALNVSNSMPENSYTLVEPPDDNSEDFKVVIEFQVPQYAVQGEIEHDDIDGIAYNKTYARIIENGTVDFFVMEKPFLLRKTQTATVMNSTFPTMTHVINPQFIKGTVKLYQYSAATENDEIPNNNDFQLSNFPNPFVNSTTISFELSAEQNEQKTISIYNIKGQKIRTLECINRADAKATKSLSHIIWDGKDEFGKSVESGIYFYQMKFGDTIIRKKMIKFGG